MRNGLNRAILVTGSIRSGSTWVGTTIAAHPRVYYVSEPFNTLWPRCPAKYRFHYVTPAEEDQFGAYLRQHMEFRIPLGDVLRDANSPEPRLRLLLRAAKHCYRRWAGHRPLLKDPHALFSAAWLARRYALDVLVLIRHPAAFVSSMKRLGWGFGFGHFLSQKELMRDLLAPYADDMVGLIKRPHTGIDEVVLLWRILHDVIRRYREQQPSWVFVRHEDLSLDPVGEFRKVYHQLGLTMSPAIAQSIQTHTSKSNPAEAGAGIVHQLKRDSRANVWNWRQRLTPSEIDHVRRATEDVARHFYTEADWALDDWQPKAA